MLNIKQIIGLVVLSIGDLLSIYSLQGQMIVESLVVGVVLVLGGVGYALWATKR